jgi:GINS complex subunit 4
MADLYNLLQDDNLLRGQDAEIEEDIGAEEEEWDQEEREHVQIRAALVEREAHNESNSDGTKALTLDYEAPLELKDLHQQDEGSIEIGKLYCKLKSLWTQEVLSPELQPYDADAISGLVDAIADQEDAAAEAQSSMNSTGNSNLDSLIGSVMKVDVSRCKFLLCSLIRERLRKIEEHPWHLRLHGEELMSKNEASSPTAYQFFFSSWNLTKILRPCVCLQAEYLKTYLKLLEGHLHKTVLDHFPPQQVWKTLDAPEMIDEPDLSTYVFCRSKEDVTIVDGDRDQAHTSRYDDTDDFDRDAAASYRAAAGACLIVRYSRVRDLFLQGKIELLM